MKFRTLPLIAIAILVVDFIGSAQSLETNQQAKYEIFSRTPLGQINFSSPQPYQIEQVTSTNTPASKNLSSQLISIFNPRNSLGQLNQQVVQQNDLLYEHDNFRHNEQIVEIQKDLMEEKVYREQIEWRNKSKYYRLAYKQLMQLNPDSFSVTKAVYIVENAWLENKYSFESFRERLQLEAKIIRQQLKNESLDVKDNLVLNYGIQKRFRKPINYYDPKKKKIIAVKPFGYDFEDFQGEKDYSKMFVTKMMIKGKGQCHSMPLMYLMIAEQLGAKAWLSLAPQHSFVQFTDKNNNMMNFEATNGNLVSSNWLLQSGFINANALKEKTYLDTLSQRQLYAQCLADLLLGYLSKFGYDAFAEQVRQQVLQVNSNNITAIIIEANIKTQIALQEINAAGRPKQEDLPKFPEAYKAYLDMLAAYDKVDGTGYQDMPKEAYQEWLKTIDTEKKKQANRELQERMKREVQQSKRIRSIVVDKTKG